MRKIIPIAIFVVIAFFFGLALYWAIEGIIGSVSYISNSYVYQRLSQGPFWWLILYYSGEGVAGTAGLVIRAIGGFFLLYANILFLHRGKSAWPQIKSKIGVVLLMEAFYFLSLIPSTITAFAYYFESGTVFYFDHTPPLILLYVAAIPTLATVTIMPTVVLKLRTKIVSNVAIQDLAKWVSLTALSYLFFVFWFSYSMAWLGNMIPFDRAKGQFGWNFLQNPINLTSFVITTFGLLFLSLFTLILLLPALRKLPAKINMKGSAVLLIAFGGYFVFNLLYFYLTGGYAEHPNVWYEMIGPPHNVNLWCLAFIIVGVAFLIDGFHKNHVEKPD